MRREPGLYLLSDTVAIQSQRGQLLVVIAVVDEIIGNAELHHRGLRRSS